VPKLRECNEMVKKGIIRDELTEPFYILTDVGDEFKDEVIELTETEAQWIEDTMKDWMLTQEFIEKKLGKT